VSTAIVPVVPESPTAAAPPATAPSMRRSNRPPSVSGSRRLTTVIEPRQRREPSDAETCLPVRCQVTAPPVRPTWKASSTRPAANAVGWPRSPGAGVKTFCDTGGWIVVALGFS
jgi:hypothetical protein